MSNLFLILELALTLLRAKTSGGAANAADSGLIYLRIAGAAAKAYEQEVGLPLDPTKIKEYEPLD